MSRHELFYDFETIDEGEHEDHGIKDVAHDEEHYLELSLVEKMIRAHT